MIGKHSATTWLLEPLEASCILASWRGWGRHCSSS